MDGLDYDARCAAGTTKIEDITTDEINREILRRLKENDPNLKKLATHMVYDGWGKDYCYRPENGHDLKLLGHFIGENTILKELKFLSYPDHGLNNDTIESFCGGVNRNRSIQRIRFSNMYLLGGEIFQSLRPFFANNYNLSDLKVDDSDFGAGCAHQLSLALGGCNESLKCLTINWGGVLSVEIIEALAAHHPLLEELDLGCMNIGRHECDALAVLLPTTTELRELDLSNNDIDDEGVDAVAGALANNSRLRILYLCGNRITVGGCQSMAALLEHPNCNLEELYLDENNIGNEGALIFANALVNNRKLKELDIDNNDITAEGYSSFSTILHRRFDMQFFFQWDLKMLPLAMNWFKQGRFIQTVDEVGVGKRKLDVIYQFVRAMPMICVEAYTCQELDRISSSKMELRRE